jgi:diguanylate cyclase (GGDEF)-like protein
MTQWFRPIDTINEPIQPMLGLFVDNPIASVMTDKHGVLIQCNPAVECLFKLSKRKLDFALGRYCLLSDPQIKENNELNGLIQDVYLNGRSQVLETNYFLGNIRSKTYHCERNFHIKVNFTPLKNSEGKVEQVLIQLQDLSNEQYTRDALQEGESSYKAFVTHSSDAIWCFDMEPPVPVDIAADQQVLRIARCARLIEGNKVLVKMLGANSIDDVLGMGLIDTGSNSYLLDLEYFVNNQYQLVDQDIVRQGQKGKKYYLQICCTGIVENGFLKRIWGSTKDVTARKRYEEKLQYQSFHDALTGLPNREKLYVEMNNFFAQRKDEEISALLLIDLDRFKEINDTLGHHVGDQLLQLIGPRLANEMTELTGIIARLGGDEFAVFLPHIRSTQQAVTLGHRLLDALSQEFNLNGVTAQIAASIGISISPDQAEDRHALMRYADVAMYHAKKQMLGASLYNAEYDPHSTKRLAILTELGRAIRDNQLSLHYQPKVLLTEKRCYGFEALIRWQHPDMGFVLPNDFIPIAELTSSIHQLTAWVLEAAIKQCREWQDQGYQLSVAVNLSARNLMDDTIGKKVERLLTKYELSPSRLELEITESAIMTDPNRAQRNLDVLNNLGIHLAIDDFGTGYSSLSYLKRLPVQTLKIDNAFVRNMMNDLQDEVIVNSTIHLAHNLGLTVVAEGVENEELLTRLSGLGCDEAQGYFIGKPMPAQHVKQWLEKSDWVQSFTSTQLHKVKD